MTLYTLGCTGWFPTQNETCCFLVEHKGCLIMLDAGTGVSNLVHFQDVLNRYDTLHIILTHYHLDHIIGLSYLPPFVREKKLCIYGPGMASYKKTTVEILNDFFQPHFFSRPLLQLARDVKCADYAKNSTFFIDNITVNCKEQVHSSPSYSIMIDDELVYVTDTYFDEDRWKNNLSVKILLHECWQLHNDICQHKHSSLEAILHGLPRKNFKKILLVHQNPMWNDNEREQITKAIEGTNIYLPYDLDIVEITEDDAIIHT